MSSCYLELLWFFLPAVSCCGLCALLNGPLKLKCWWKEKIISHSLPAFHFFFIFSQAALRSQISGLVLRLAGNKSNKASILLLKSTVNTKPASLYSPHTSEQCIWNVIISVRCKVLSASHCKPTEYVWIPESLNIHVVPLHIVGYRQ